MKYIPQLQFLFLLIHKYNLSDDCDTHFIMYLVANEV